MEVEFWQSILAEGARSLALRLQSGEIRRTQRSDARALLVRAFDALDEGAISADLAREVDSILVPEPTIPRVVKLMGPPMMGIVDGDFIHRLWAPERQVELMASRIGRFLATIKREEVRQFLQVPSEGEGNLIDFEYTEG